ncbi:DNA repair exonuclease SbcCD nuclease subunit [Sphingobacterium sp. JUb21]|nr:DNA repair exonuclease SbcCD nuclease subunit [Sphingobacterium sp. JUb21]
MKYCIEKNIDVLLLCGDIIDWDNRFFEAYGPLQEAFDTLGKHNVTIYVVSGNHDFDVLPQIITTGNNQHVHLLGQDEKWEASKFSKNGHTIQFVGWSFARRFVTKSPMLSWDSVILDPNHQTIGLLHGDLDSSNSHYGPVRLDELRNTDISLWLMGHIHKPQQLAEHPLVWYTGSPQALSAKEPAVHGPLLITVSADQPLTIEHIGMSPVRYKNISIDVSGVENVDAFRNKIIYGLKEDAERMITELEEVLSLVYQLRLTGKSSLVNEIESWKSTVIEHSDKLETGTMISVRRVEMHISPEVIDLNQLAQQSSPAGILANTILAIEENRTDLFLDDLIKEWVVKVEHANRVGAYLPLSAGRQLNNTTETARIALKAECNRLLGELLNQHKSN